MKKKLLIVVDYQNDFITGTLGFQAAKDIKPAIIKKVKEYCNDEIIFLKDTHDHNYLKTIEGKKLPVPHTIKGTYGWEIRKEVLAAATNPIIFEKNTFGSTELFKYLLNKKYYSIELVGLLSNMCVLANGVIAKTCCPNAKIIVNRNCTTSITEELNDEALDIMKNLHFEIK